jgi:hypothetical protein
MTKKNPIDRLTSLGEEVLGKASQNPTAARFIQTATQVKDHVDDLSKRVRGLEERRLAKIEYAAKKKPPPAARKTTAPKKAS